MDKRERRRVRRAQLRKARARHETQAKQAAARFSRASELEAARRALHPGAGLDATRCPACRPRAARTALALPVEDPTAGRRLGG